MHVKKLIIDAEVAEQRVDNFLFRVCKGVPKTRIYRAIRTGEVRVNKKRIQASYKLQAEDQIRIPPLRTAESGSIEYNNPELLTKLQASIIYESPNLLIINKPSGFAVHGGSGIKLGVIEGLRKIYPQPNNVELVHRLDRDTSGCLLIAKKRPILRELHALLRQQQIEKNYLALVRGKWTGGKQNVELPLQKNILRSGERVVVVDPAGRAASSEFIPQQRFADATLLLVKLHTGRTHQIRVHAAAIDHPVAGDNKYGNRGFNTAMREWGLQRLFLHAKSLQFTIPSSGEVINVNAKLPPDLLGVLNGLTR